MPIFLRFCGLIFYIAAGRNDPMCQHDDMHPQRRGNKRLTMEKNDDPFEANFKTSMLFTKSMKSFTPKTEC